MIKELAERTVLNSLGAIGLFACVLFLAPLNLRIVIAQQGTSLELTVMATDEGNPPAPNSPAPSSPAPSPTALSPTTQLETSEVVSAEEIAEATDVLAEITQSTATQRSAQPDTSETKSPKSTAPENKTVRNLSVEPGLRPLLPEDRPSWVGAPPLLTESDHFLYVGSLPVPTAKEADAALDEPLAAVLRNYIEGELLRDLGAAASMPIDADFIRKNLIDTPEGYLAELSTSEGSMFQKWITVRITPEQRAQIQLWHKEALQRERLGPLGVGLFFVLGAVALSHAMLRRWHGAAQLPVVNHQLPVESATRGFASLTWLWVVLGILILLPVVLLSLVLVRPTQHVPAQVEIRSGAALGTDSDYSNQLTIPNQVRILSGSKGNDSRTIIIND